MIDVYHFARSARRLLIGCILIACIGIGFAQSTRSGDTGIITAREAAEKAAAGELLIIDVRTSGEWRKTGIPRGATRANIFDSDFLDRVKRAVGSDLSQPIAVVCARGGRSTRAQQLLRRTGFKVVHNIKEGMLGGAHGQGWLAGGHPTERCDAC